MNRGPEKCNKVKIKINIFPSVFVCCSQIHDRRQKKMYAKPFLEPFSHGNVVMAQTDYVRKQKRSVYF